MLDEALLRPGRLEVQVEIGLPDERGRVQILQVRGGWVGGQVGRCGAAPAGEGPRLPRHSQAVQSETSRGIWGVKGREASRVDQLFFLP